MDNNFKIGDMVKIINISGDHCVPTMKNYVGSTTTIYAIIDTKIYVVNNGFFWKKENLMKLNNCIFAND